MKANGLMYGGLCEASRPSGALLPFLTKERERSQKDEREGGEKEQRESV